MDDVFRETAPFYVEHARRHVVERYGNERLLQRRACASSSRMDLEQQRAAQAAMLAGLMEVDHRQGYGGPVANVAGAEREGARRAARDAPGRRAKLEVGRATASAIVRAGGRPARPSPRCRWASSRGLLPLAGHALGAQAEPGGLLPRRRSSTRPVHRR